MQEVRFLSVLRIALSKLIKDKTWTLLQVGLITLTLTFFSIIVPLTLSLNQIMKRYSEFSINLIEVEPKASHKTEIYLPSYPVTMNELRAFENLTLRWYKKGLFFTEDDVNRISQIDGVKKVVRVQQFNLCFNLTKYGEYLRDLGLEPPEGYKPPEIIRTSVFCLEVEKVQGVLAYFNNIIEGRFLEPGENGTVVISYAEMIPPELMGGLPFGEGKVPEKVYFIIGNVTYEFSVVGVVVADPFKVQSIADLSYMRELIIKEFKPLTDHPVFLDFYTRVFVLCESVDDVIPVAKAIRDIYPEAGVYFQAVQSRMIVEILKTFTSTYNFMAISTFVVTVSVALLARVVEVRRKKEEIGLLKALGWRDRDILLMVVSMSVFIGLISGGLSVVVSLVVGYYLRLFLMPDLPRTHPTIQYELEAVFEVLVRRLPDVRFLVLAPFVGVLISVVGALLMSVYILRLTPADALKEG